MEKFSSPQESIEDIGRLIETAYTDDFSQAAQRVDAIFKQMGAKVLYGVSYTGEPIVRLFIRPEQSDEIKAFSNRPA